MAKTKESKIQIKLVRSLIGCPETQRKIAHALGLKKKDQIDIEFNDGTIKAEVI